MSLFFLTFYLIRFNTNNNRDFLNNGLCIRGNILCIVHYFGEYFVHFVNIWCMKERFFVFQKTFDVIQGIF